jgi:membrane fusion protein (multidrug efflux system)
MSRAGDDDEFNDDGATVVTPIPLPASGEPWLSQARGSSVAPPAPPQPTPPMMQQGGPQPRMAPPGWPPPGPQPMMPPAQPMMRPSQPMMAQGDVASDPKLEALRSLSLNKDPSLPRTPVPQAQHAASTHRSRFITILPWALLAALGGVLAIHLFVTPLWGSKHGSAAKQSGPKTEVVTPVNTGGQPLHAAGYIAAHTPIIVGSAVPGRVKAIKVKEGDKIKKNQVLAELDDGHARADLTLANATLRDAKRRLKRVQTLRKVEAATAADLESAIGQVEISQAALAPILQRIEDAKIRSPIDGTVMEKLVQPGAMVVGNTGILKLADLTKLVAEIDVNEADLANVKLDQKAEVSSDAFADRTFPGVVKEIAEEADRSKGTVTVKIYLDVPDNTLRPGMSVKVTFEATDARTRLLISKSALDGAGKVYVVGPDGSITPRELKTESAGPSKVEVLEGLKPGETILSSPQATPQP